MRAFVGASLVLLAVGCSETQVSHHIPEPVVIEPAVPMTHDFAVPVLMYHRITDLTPEESRSPLLRDLSVSPADFEEQLKFLRENDFVFLHVSDVERALREGKPLPERAVAITMDDGYQDNFSQALPLLQKYEAKATVFMVTNNFGRAARLSWPEAKEMHKQKVSFESHSVSHPDLTAISDGQLWDELVDSKHILETGLGIEVRSIAYPAGAYDSDVVAAVERAGYFAGWKKGGGPVMPGNSAELYELPRIRVHGQTDLEKFKARVMSGVYIIAEQRSRDS